jgi:hypothetical protein
VRKVNICGVECGKDLRASISFLLRRSEFHSYQDPRLRLHIPTRHFLLPLSTTTNVQMYVEFDRTELSTSESINVLNISQSR